jgi:hypothetical protein
MGVLEFLGAHVLGPLIGLVQRMLAKPRPELKIHELTATGGSADGAGQGVVDFAAIVQNVGNKSARATVTARVGGEKMKVDKPVVELLPSAPSLTVRIFVPRTQLGNLVKAFADETTLYGRTLTVEIAEGRHRAIKTWREIVYDAAENRERHDIQQREWRIGRGEASEEDYVAAGKGALLRRHRENVERGRGTGRDYET